MSSDLKPCPFCQSDDVMVLDAEPTGQMSEYSHVICCDCNATGPMKRSDHAAEEAWNTRAPTGDIADELIAALTPLASLKAPNIPRQGNAGFYSIRFEAIRQAQETVAKATGGRIDE